MGYAMLRISLAPIVMSICNLAQSERLIRGDKAVTMPRKSDKHPSGMSSKRRKSVDRRKWVKVHISAARERTFFADATCGTHDAVAS